MKSKSVNPLLIGAGAVGVLALGVWAAVRKKTSAPATSPPAKVPPPSGGAIVPPPPDAVWLQPTPEEPTPASGGAPAGGAPSGGAPTAGSPSGGAPGWQVSTPAGVTYLDAVAFLDERFAVTENKPTSSQLSRITAAFTELGVQADGKIYARPTLEAVNKGFDLATAFDMEKAPAAVGGAVRDFTKAAYQSLPLPLARTA